MRCTGCPDRLVVVFVLLAAGLVVSGCDGAATASDEPADDRLKVLFLGDNGLHRPAERAVQLVPAMLHRGIEITYTEDAGDLNEATLGRYDALLIYANIDEITPEQEAALLGYVEGGGGLVALHSASFCFRNSRAYVDLVGAQFRSHGGEVFRTRIAEPDHPIMRGLEPIESWDETYVHTMHNEENRTVLSYREDEPYTWVRTQGEGRVFYTAWGHDERTWGQPEFVDLVERGTRWAAGQDVQAVLGRRPILDPFEYVEQKVAYYPPGAGRRGDGDWNEMQQPLPPEESMKHIVTPGGFELQLFAAEPDIRKPICMAWDERGRLWIAETRDYPNEMQEEGEGRDRITILEDTTGDGRADQFTVFAEDLSIPTSMAFANGGLIVHQAPHTLFLKDTTGDDRADHREVLFTGWNTYDTHAGPSNLQYGFDNWFWSMQGYAGFDGEVGGEGHEFHMGFFRFTPDASRLEFLRSTNNNTWGLGFTEDGLALGSTANNNPSVYMPIPNRYYDAVHDFDASTLRNIAPSARFLPITDRIRQVDVHGGYTSAAGHALYTARAYPREYWNRIAFVTDPTGNLIGQFVVEREGADVRTYNPSNLVSSDDEWASPIMAEVGPDGHVWFIDWYTFITQHNPTPVGYETGPGNAYETDLRDTRHGRIYRVVYKGAEEHEPITLHDAGPEKLVATLSHDNLFWRRHAQRLLVERGETDVTPGLIELVRDTSVDEIGLNAGAIHALWTLHGLGELDGSNAEALAAAAEAMGHPSAGVRRNAVMVLPPTAATTQAVLSADVLSDEDGQVRLAGLLALADVPASIEGGRAVREMIEREENRADRWLRDAATIAGARHSAGFLGDEHEHAADDDGGERAAGADEPEGPNLLPNFGFEEVDGEGEPAGWRVRHYSGQAEQTVADAGRRAGRALRISSGSGADSSFFARAEVKPDTRYRLSAWIRTEGIETRGNAHGALLNVHELQDADGNRTPPLTGDNDWTRVETTFNSGGRESVTINTLFGGWGPATGTAWYDEVSLVELAGGGEAEGIGEIVAIVRAHADRQAELATASAAERIAEIEDEADPDTAVLRLGVVPNVMQYDEQTLTVRAGQKVRLVFTNTDHMQHNVLILRPGTLEAVGALADQMVADPDAQARDYVPDTPDVLIASRMLDPHDQQVIEFTAPDDPGEYPYVCTFPGHWRIMNGTLVVEPAE